jgi:hypothetical protein
MRRFQLGDDVRVAYLPASEWQNRVGTIVEIFELEPHAEENTAQECVVDLGGERRCFMNKHLVKTVSARMVRFFRAEVSERWQLDPNDIATLNGDRQGLIDLLCDRLSFAIRRAEAEVDDFYATFNDRIARAIELPARKNAA